MIPFDINEIILETEAHLMVSSEGRLLYTHFNTSPAKRMEDLTVSRVWRRCLKELEESAAVTSPSLAAEKLVAALIRTGVRREMVHYHNNLYRVPLENNIFMVRRDPSGIDVRPFTIYAGQKTCYVSLDTGMMVDLILEFEAAMPQIRLAAQRVFTYYRKKELEREIENIVRAARERELFDKNCLHLKQE